MLMGGSGSCSQGDAMAELQEIINFLEAEDSLQLGDSPWQPPDEAEEYAIYELDWDRLFRGDDSDELFDVGQFANDIEPWVGRGVEDLNVEDAPAIESRHHFCAWYQPIHFFGYDFGIFIRQECIVKWARWIAPFVGRHRLSWHTLCRQLIRAATVHLFLHEQYHHKIESLGLRLHVAHGASCYLPYKKNIYRRYMWTDDQLEEALANAEGHSRLDEKAYKRGISAPVRNALREYLEWSFPHCAPGYRLAPTYLDRSSFMAGEDVLQERVRTATLTNSPGYWPCAPQMTRSLLNVRQQVKILVPPRRRPIVPVTAAPVSTGSTRAIVKLCESRGCTKKKGGKGSHLKMTSPNGDLITIPGGRKNLSPDVARNIAKAIGFRNIEELRDAVRDL